MAEILPIWRKPLPNQSIYQTKKYVHVGVWYVGREVFLSFVDSSKFRSMSSY